MTARGRICPNGCGAQIVWAHAPRGGTVPLQPYPEPDGRYRVATRGAGTLVILAAGEELDAPTKRYHPHAPHCIPADKAVPRVRPQQLPLPIGDPP